MRPTVESANGTVTSETKFLTNDEEIVHESPAHTNDLEVELNSNSLGIILLSLSHFFFIFWNSNALMRLNCNFNTER